MELEGEGDRAGDVDVMEPAGRDHLARSRFDNGVVGVILEDEGESSGVHDLTSPDAVCNAMCAAETGRVVVLVEGVGGADMFKSVRQLDGHVGARWSCCSPPNKVVQRAAMAATRRRIRSVPLSRPFSKSSPSVAIALVTCATHTTSRCRASA